MPSMLRDPVPMTRLVAFEMTQPLFQSIGQRSIVVFDVKYRLLAIAASHDMVNCIWKFDS